MNAWNPSLLQVLSTDRLVWLPLPLSTREVIAQIFESARDFFNSPLSLKSQNVLVDECGYRRLGIEYSASPERPDQIESFTVSPRVPAANNDLPLPNARLLYAQMLAVFHDLEPVAEDLAIQLANQVSGGDWAEKLAGSLKRWSRLQLNYSRPAFAEATNIHDIHEDGNLLTLACATAPGLEVQMRSGDFVKVPPSTEAMLIMPGEIAWLLSAGEIQPVWHRVIPEPQIVERLALMLFVDIDPNLCEPWVQGGINEGIDIGERVLTNGERFGLARFAVD